VSKLPEIVLVLSSDDGFHLDFLPLVSAAWRKFFPEFKIALVVCGNHTREEYAERCQKYVDYLYAVPLHPGYSRMNTAKMARLWYACQFRGRVVTLNDMDLIPLNRWFYETRYEQYVPGKLMLMGEEVYAGIPHEKGKAPMSALTCESELLSDIVNPKGLDFYHFLIEHTGKWVFDSREDCGNKDGCFLDESLFMAMRSKWSKKDTHVVSILREYNTVNDTVDRAYWVIDPEKLAAGNYHESHMKKPLHSGMHRDDIRPLAAYIGDASLVDAHLQFPVEEKREEPMKLGVQCSAEYFLSRMKREHTGGIEIEYNGKVYPIPYSETLCDGKWLMGLRKTRERIALIEEQIKDIPRGRYFDIGCNIGNFVNYFSHSFTQSHGADCDRDYMMLWSQVWNRGQFACCDFNQTTFTQLVGKAQYNLITALSVIENIRDVPKLLAEVYASLYDGGVFILEGHSEDIPRGRDIVWETMLKVEPWAVTRLPVLTDAGLNAPPTSPGRPVWVCRK
jgi:SAM-dependent methyltransferase